jgi:pimeloyl-ACP methyl ester carboxylesterase
VTWFGDDSQIHIPLLGDLTPDYHVNVIHALAAAGALASNINSHIRGDITLAAHSLGNVLSSATITKHGANVARYFMINGAVAMEAFDGAPSIQSKDMCHPDWSSYDESLWCSEWHTHFPEGDGRHALTWRNYFSSGASVAYNFYSSGEDVLKTHPYATHPGLWCYFGGEYAWCLQEKLKGMNWISSIGGSTHGGWGLNDYYWDVTQKLHVAPTNQQMILSRPFFRPGGAELATLYVPTDTNQTDVGSALATTKLPLLLAGFIPSRTLPTGANRLATWPTTRNYNMQHTALDDGFQNAWPPERDNSDWHHSDLREVAYLYIYKLFDKFRDLGGLNQP